MIRSSWFAGLAVVCGLTVQGCTSGPAGKELTDKDAKTSKPVEQHAHEHGPHDGEVVEMGDNHGEVVLEADKKATLYILDGALKNPVPMADTTAELALKIGTEVTKVELKAMPLDGEKDGKASRFQSAGALPESIKDGHDIKGDVNVTTGGKTMTYAVGH